MITLNKNVNLLSTEFDKLDYKITELASLQSILAKYNQHFLNIVKLQQRIGLHAKDGLYGELRSAVH